MADAPTDTSREAWITGIGIVSCLGEGPDAHWQGLGSGKPDFVAAATLARERVAARKDAA